MTSQNQHPVQWMNPSNRLNRHKANDEEIDNKQYITIINSTSNVVSIEKHRMPYNFILDLTKHLAQDVEDKNKHNVNSSIVFASIKLCIWISTSSRKMYFESNVGHCQIMIIIKIFSNVISSVSLISKSTSTITIESSIQF